ncbi:MAG: hypothetical protein KF778_03520 [Rhodocyclaceae bacterium]|nr:hypothetical protein [Rhodocyclaceae bacterium]MBX3667448.1 hypothetical protein [Rhodocyclaceae bacterium]
MTQREGRKLDGFQHSRRNLRNNEQIPNPPGLLEQIVALARARQAADTACDEDLDADYESAADSDSDDDDGDGEVTRPS